MADTPNLNQITDTTNAQRAAGTTLLGNQNALTSDFLNRYTSAIGGQETSSAMAGRIGQELGIPTLQSNANTLRTTLNNIPTTYNKATTGFDVNANQLARVVGQKASELAPAVDTAERALSSAQGNLNTRMGYEQADQAKALTPYSTEQNLLQDRLARETSMFTNENENELNGLISKINAGITLSEGEKNRANTLAAQEASFNNQMKLQKDQQQFTSSQPNFVGVNGGLYNTTAGKFAVKPPLSAFG